MTKTTSKTLTWTAREPAGGRRWWGFLLVAYFTPPIAIVLYAVGNWSASLVVAAIGLTVFVVYLPRPRVWAYRLCGTKLTASREHRRGPADEMTIDLTKYHSVDMHPLRALRGDRSQVVLTLWPKARFASDVDIYIPGSSKTIQRALLVRVERRRDRA